MDIIVKKKKWSRGNYPNFKCGGNGGNLLNGDDNKMCCLGFACRQLGLKPKDIMDVGMPSGLHFGYDHNKRTDEFMKKIEVLVNQRGKKDDRYYEDRSFVKKAAKLNDDPDITDEVRMTKLTALFKKNGHNITFV
jgi:hypothetical protein